jgi:hypothetical protein
MKKRVDELKLGKKGELAKDMVTDEVGEVVAADDGFRIVGVKKSDDYTKERPLFEQQRRRNVFLAEVKTFKRGLSVFPQKGKEENGNDEFTEGKVMDRSSSKSEKYETAQPENKPGVKKMKFGFSDSEE